MNDYLLCSVEYNSAVRRITGGNKYICCRQILMDFINK